jgi:hypothetical protein
MVKIHGQGGAQGHHTKEMKHKYETSIRIKEKIQRTEAKKNRYAQRKIDWIKDELINHIGPTSTTALDRVITAVKIKKVSKPVSLIITLAVDAWHVEEILKTLNSKKISKDIFTEQDLESFHFLSPEKRKETMEALLPNRKIKIGSRNSSQLKEDIEKWKRRVPKIAQGHYF